MTVQRPGERSGEIPPAERTADAGNGYRSVLKSTTLIGGSSFVAILIGMVRTKLVAVLIGPDGVGFFGVMNSILGIVSTATGLGIPSSGVRRIAEVVGKSDEHALSKTVLVLRRVVLFTGTAGMLVTISGSRRLSVLSFGTPAYSLPIAALGACVFFSAVSSGQSSLLQGFRRISSLAKMGLIGSVCGLGAAVPCCYFLGKNGVVPSLILGSIATLAASWWFSHRIQLAPVRLSLQDCAVHASRLLGFGVPLMLSSLLWAVDAYLINIFLTRASGLEAVGLYQAANSLSGVLVNFVLGAMGTDYYPRLVAVAHDNGEIGREANIQTETALLLAVPLLAITILFMPSAVQIFYSGKFNASVGILRWAVFGVFGRVVSWPLTFIILAKGKGVLFLVSELVSATVHLGSILIGFTLWNLPGTGVAFAFLYLFYTAAMLILSRAIAHVTWARPMTIQVCTYLLILTALSALSISEIPSVVKWAGGGLSIILLSLRNLRRLSKLSGIQWTDLSACIAAKTHR